MADAESLRRQLAPLADRNPLAAVYLARLALADDPDAEAERIIGEMRAVVARFAAVGERIARALRPVYDRWIEYGQREAEQWANEGGRR